jgi:hypothetical protein
MRLSSRAAAEFIANPVEWRDHIGREAAGFLQHGVNIVRRKLAALRQNARKSGPVLQREGDIGNRRAIGHVSILVPAVPASTYRYTPWAVRATFLGNGVTLRSGHPRRISR